jgi:hypothetical protein
MLRQHLAVLLPPLLLLTIHAVLRQAQALDAELSVWCRCFNMHCLTGCVVPCRATTDRHSRSQKRAAAGQQLHKRWSHTCGLLKHQHIKPFQNASDQVSTLRICQNSVASSDGMCGTQQQSYWCCVGHAGG